MRARTSSLLLILLLGAAAQAQAAGSADRSRWSLFGQTGWTEDDVSSYAIGAHYVLPWRGRFAGTTVSSYAEFTVSQWIADRAEQRDTDRFTQVGIAPVLRLQHPSYFPGLFLDLGIGANLITPLYRNGDKRFGSAYNFGDQIAVGFRMGRAGRQEISVRVQHFSNAGIKHPNPGENFLQARVAMRFAD